VPEKKSHLFRFLFAPELSFLAAGVSMKACFPCIKGLIVIHNLHIVKQSAVCTQCF